MHPGEVFELIVHSDEFLYLVGYFFGVVIGSGFIFVIVDDIWKMVELERHRDKTLWRPLKGMTRYSWLAGTVGVVERTLYISTILINKPEFIAIWLTLKTIARAPRWTRDEAAPGRAVYNIFIIGNGLSIIFSFVSAWAIKLALGLSVKTNPILAIGAPITLVVACGLLIGWLRLHKDEIESSIAYASED